MLLFAHNLSLKSSHYKTVSGVIKERSFWHFNTIFPLLLFGVLFGMRYDVGSDYLSYLFGYTHDIDVSKGEPLFDAITHLFQGLDLHYVFYFSFLAFFQVFFFFYAFKKERYLFPLLVFFLFTNSEWSFWMNVIRQAMAICLWVYALKYIEEKRLWRYLLWCIIAFLCHYSAIILIVFYPLLRSGKDYFKSIKLQLGLILAAFIVQLVFISILPKLGVAVDFYKSILGTDAYANSYDLESLSESFTASEGTGLIYLIKIGLHIVIIIYSTKLKNFYKNKWFNIIYFFFFFGLLTTYIFPVGFISLTRPFRYFYIFQTIMYAYFAFYLRRNKTPQNRLIYVGLIILFVGIFLLSQITATEDSHLWYQFYFQQ
jgi:hypothetical protein